MVRKYCSNYNTNEICKNYLSQRTFDNIPIRKIMIANISPRTTHKDLKKEFESYGKVIDCHLKTKLVKNSYAFIVFEDSASASSAIEDGYHRRISIDNHYLRVLPSAAWNQPDRNNIPINLANTEENILSAYDHYSSNNESPISILNEYCLLYIFGFLPIRDAIKIERVCRYWQIISRESLNLYYKKFDSLLTNDNWKYISNAPTLYNILEKFGLYITKVNDLQTCSFAGNATLIAIAKLCPNIKEIKLLDFPFKNSGIKALAKHCTKIKHFTIGRSSCENTKYDSDNIKYDSELSGVFLKNRNIQFLHINDNIVDGSCLKHLSYKYINHIYLTNQHNCSLFSKVISKIPNLVTLYINNCNGVNKLFHNEGFKLNAQNIENLTITLTNLRGCFAIKNFLESGNLKNLKYLNFENNYNTENILFDIIGENNYHKLRYLNISGTQDIINEDLFCIINSLSNLEHFHMNRLQLVTDEIFCFGMPNLKTLDCSFCPKIKDDGLIMFINNSHKLEKLFVNDCRLITNRLIFAAIECTKNKTNKIVLLIEALNTQVNVDLSVLKKSLPFLKCNYGTYGSYHFED